ncbi:MAG TPA: glycosyltransferase family 4 protein [Dissulfurispiraceae bacterium]|nr:glycosyltransferase family 4 protein [Dissulfurispiraceae bacterium]
MHVLQLGPYPPPEGGITRNLVAIREELQKSGHKCSIIVIAKSSKVTPDPDIHHPRSPFALIKLLCKLEYDILHLHIGGEITFRIFGLMTVCAFLGRGKSVLTVHSGGFAVSEHAKNAKPFSLPGFVFRWFERVICVNNLMLAVFEKFGLAREKVRLIYPFVSRKPDKSVQLAKNLKEFAEKHKPFLLTVGLLEDAYDLFMQIDAMERIINQMPEAGLMIVGSGSLEHDLQRTIAKKTYSAQILLTGDVEHALTLHLINDCDILLRTTKFDGDAISIREALHLGTPVIATDNSMRPEGVHLIPIRDADALVKKIEELAESKQRPQSQRVDDRRNIEAILKLYEEILKQDPH